MPSPALSPQWGAGKRPLWGLREFTGTGARARLDAGAPLPEFDSMRSGPAATRQRVFEVPGLVPPLRLPCPLVESC
jgi:hypothetical protein